MAPYRPRKSALTEYATDEEDMITYDVEEDELERNLADKYVLGEYWRNNPDKYLRALTPTRFRKTELAERWTELPQVSDESRSFFRVHTSYFSNIPKRIKAEFIASWACSQSSVVSSSKR
ncbi:hypothetical protein TNCV_2650321 [Trichonephila clavipes]|nr:hypothetical protein TNCV_2650321 [Trichonephila clavipes]